MLRPQDYKGSHGTRYENPPRLGCTSVPILTFLKGQPWDEYALAFVHCHHPTCIRVSTGELKTDSWAGRVTVIIDAAERIEFISQEVFVGLPEGIEHAHALDEFMRKRGVIIDR